MECEAYNRMDINHGLICGGLRACAQECFHILEVLIDVFANKLSSYVLTTL